MPAGKPKRPLSYLEEQIEYAKRTQLTPAQRLGLSSSGIYTAEENKPRKFTGSITGGVVAPRKEGDTLIITLPLPPAQLQPNRKASVHYFQAAKLVKATRHSTAFIAGMLQLDQPLRRARMDVEIWTARKIDTDNIWAWLKSTRDGIADAWMLGNDAELECGELCNYYGKGGTGGRREMVLTITPVI